MSRQELSAKSLRSSASSASSVGFRVQRRSSLESSKQNHDSMRSSRKSKSSTSFHKSLASIRSGSAASQDALSIGSLISKTSKSVLSDHENDSVSPNRRRSSGGSVSSRRSSRSTPSFEEQLEAVAERSQHSEMSGSIQPRRRSSRDDCSRRSRQSKSSKNKSSMSNSYYSHRSSLVSTGSRRSMSSRKSTNSRRSSSSYRGSSTQLALYSDQSSVAKSSNKKPSILLKGRLELESKRFSDAIKTFTSAIQARESSQAWSGSDDSSDDTKGGLSALYRYRCEALYEIGLYALAATDARKALKLGQSTSKSKQIMRAKTLCLLGYSLLRVGNLDTAKKSFDDSIDLIKQIEKDRDERLKTIMDESNTGINEIDNYEALNAKLKDSSRKGYIKDLDNILAISPGDIDLHVNKIKHLMSQKRWFYVANHCEQMAAKRARYCGVDMTDSPFPNMKLEEFDPEYFTQNDLALPPHLRVLPTAATREAALLLPKEVSPYYLTSLRLEDRFDSALLVGRALQDQKPGDSVDSIEQEWQKLNQTIELREKGNVFYRNGEFDRAAKLYIKCLRISSAAESGGKLNAMLHYDRGKCYYAVGKYQDATTEFTHAITLHSMYSNAILHRARCYVQMKDMKKASANFERYLTLVEGAQEIPYPPLYKGSACYFDMPADVTYREVELVKSEMKKHRITPTIDGGGERQRNAVTASDVTSFLEKVSDALTELFCKKNAASQVVVGKDPIARENGSTPTLRIASAAHESNLRSSMISRTSTADAKSVRFYGDPPSHAPTVRSNTVLTIVHEFDDETRGGALEP